VSRVSRSESKVQPLVAFVGSGLHIMLFLVVAHCLPNAIAMAARLLVDCYDLSGLWMYLRIDTIVEDLSAHKEDHVPNTQPDEGGVAGSVQRLVRFPIDLR
jgi:hypothetical protein